MTALWALTPLSYARDRASAIGSCLEAALKVAVTIFVVKLTVFVTRIVTSLMWWALEGFFPLEVPERIKLIVGALAELSAEVALLAVLLGYTWTKAREHFGRWATVAFKDGEGDAEAEVLV